MREPQPAATWQGQVEELGPRQRLLLEKIGYPYGLELWEPHFTVSRIDPAHVGRIEEVLNTFSASVVADQIALGVVGHTGTFESVVSTWRLAANGRQRGGA